MCGIAGKILFKTGEVEEKDLRLMTDKLIHRGPDNQGTYISSNKRVGLAHTRLAVIDLSPGAKQPMRYSDGCLIVFNGEVFNYQREKAKLEKQGFRFNSRSDTEVVLALYHQYGVKCLNYLRGQFALAIYDPKRKGLLLARDRLGKCPLKYFINNKVLIFASELKAILTQSEVRPEVDWLALHHYLTYGYVPSPQTGFLGINKLEPGTYLWVDLETGKIKKVTYWDIDFRQKLTLSEDEWQEQILKELREAVKLRMIADVPVGCFLSGGVDSSGVLAMMAELSNRPVKTFTIGFKNSKYDESGYANALAKLFQTDHVSLTVEPESIELLSDLVYQFEEPFADSSTIISFLISRLAKKYVTVALNGDGGDENFAGYNRHFKLDRDVKLDRFKPVLASGGLVLTELLTKISPKDLWKKSNKYIHNMATDWRLRYVSYNSFFSQAEKAELYKSRLLKKELAVDSQVVYLQKCLRAPATDPRDQALYTDIKYYLCDDLLTKADIAGMRVALETRSPFLDHKLVQLAASMPFDLKIKDGVSKYILKKALTRYIPKENLYRPKMGFSIPLSEWYCGKISEFTKSKLMSPKAMLGKILFPNKISRYLTAHSETNDMGPKLWCLLALELWFEQFFS
jgi:asparagine synthase (glutamine-hydrolysing)